MRQIIDLLSFFTGVLTFGTSGAMLLLYWIGAPPPTYLMVQGDITTEMNMYVIYILALLSGIIIIVKHIKEKL